jgi:sugar lactone lactonase YvrE
LYIADTGNDLLRKLDARGVMTTVAGCPDAMSDMTRVCLDNPVGVAVDSRGDVYVTDSGHNRVLRLDATGSVTVYAGQGGSGAADSIDRTRAMFANPRGLAVGPDDALYVADFGNGAIRRVDDAGVSTVVRSISEVTGVSVSEDGTIYFTSTDAIALGRVRDGSLERLTSARVHPLEGIVVDASGVVFADAGGYRVRRVEPDGAVLTLFGDGRFGPLPGRVAVPRGLAVYRDGYAVADSGHHRVLWFRAQSAP